MAEPAGAIRTIDVRRGPLPEPWRSEAIAGWGRYDARLADEEEWADEFERGPSGPAVHVLALTEDGHLAGHHCTIPLPFRRDGEPVLLSKGEALFVDPDRRVPGAYAVVGGRRLKLAQALTRVLYDRYAEFGLAGYIGYATPGAETRHVEAGCTAIELPYARFFLVRDAGRFVSGARVLGSALRRAPVRIGLGAYAAVRGLRARGARSGPAIAEVDGFDAAAAARFERALEPGTLALEPSAELLAWRFGGPGYRRYSVGDGYLVSTRVEGTGRLRVVDWLLDPDDVPAVVAALASAADEEGAAAVEWSVPATSPRSRALAAALRRSALVADPRRRAYRMVVHGDGLASARWSLTLATQERF